MLLVMEELTLAAILKVDKLDSEVPVTFSHSSSNPKAADFCS